MVRKEWGGFVKNLDKDTAQESVSRQTHPHTGGMRNKKVNADGKEGPSQESSSKLVSKFPQDERHPGFNTTRTREPQKTKKSSLSIDCSYDPGESREREKGSSECDQAGGEATQKKSFRKGWGNIIALGQSWRGVGQNNPGPFDHI